MTKPKRYCAIYTRKSTEEGLEQEFNSLDAQREACTAFIESQKHEGWKVLDSAYDDGGFSGGTLDRPGLTQLLSDIEAGKIHIVVVYKVDRLTRSLSDFAKIVDIFDQREVAFVSVTQQFNTTTSMGRLTLNVLLSFAQFEREVTGERIRDKVAASKKKGMWMGGNVPLGYDLKDRALFINEAEATKIRSLYSLYLEHGSVGVVEEEASRQGIRSKSGAALTRGVIYKILNNPIYAGDIRHKEQIYPGLHQGIIDRSTWDGVQTQLAQNRYERKNGTNAREPSLLAGKLFSSERQPFTPSHASKKGKRYRYYIERKAVIADTKEQNPKKKRIAASEIETLVTGAITTLLKSPTELDRALNTERLTPDEAKLRKDRTVGYVARIESDYLQERELLHALIERVFLHEDHVEVLINRNVLRDVLLPSTNIDANYKDEDQYVITIPAHLRCRGVELKFVIEGDRLKPRAPDISLVRAVVKAHGWWDGLLKGEFETLSDIAKSEMITDRYVRQILNLVFLAPDLKASILDGTQPVELSTDKLVKMGNLPLGWADQRRLLGFELPKSP